MKELLLTNFFIVLLFYSSFYWLDWHIEHNELNIKKIKPSKYFCPICCVIAKRKGRYVKLELLYIITEIYAHSYLLVSAIICAIIINKNIYWLSKYLFVGAIVICFIIEIVYMIISGIKNKI